MSGKGNTIKALELKVKASSLAAETKIIRRLECRTLHQARRRVIRDVNAGRLTVEKADIILREARKAYEGLHRHRAGVVRKEARATHLARAFLRGLPYRWIEKTIHTAPPLTKALSIALRFSNEDGRAITHRFYRWVDEAELPGNMRQS